MDGLCLKAAGIHAVSSPPASAIEVRSNPTKFGAVGCAAANGISSSEKPPPSSFPRLFTGNPLRSLWPGNRSRPRNGLAVDDAVVVADDGGGERGVVDSAAEPRVRDFNWAVKILHLRSRRTEEVAEEEEEEDGRVVEDLAEKESSDVVDESASGCDGGEEGEECDVCRVDDDGDDGEAGKEGALDRDSFSRLLRRVTLAEAKFYAQMSYLGNLAYSIPNIKPRNLLRHYGLHMVTSSIEKKGMSAKCEKDQTSIEVGESEGDPKDAVGSKEQNNTGYLINAFAAYQFAASYLHSCTRNILPFKFLKGKACPDSEGGDSLGNNCVDIMNPEMASIIVTTDSVTAVVAAEEEVKQAVANNLNSTRSSPCEWFVCDDEQSGTRFFVIQGSESLASWQANLLFEPIQLEGLDVLVHRGIYEAAKGIYEQMLPEVQAHLKSRGDLATFRFTGHSLGGSLALLINLMLLIRGEVPLSALLPVITFGSPSIMCGGNRLLRKLGLPRSHLQAITMHRDIVPRAFSCNYPKRVAELLKAVNGNFRNHPCLNNQKLLYAPMGELLILQPEGKFSPHHHLLPAGSGLYLLSCPLPDSTDAEKQILSAQIMFLNSPHPLEILSDRSSYGSDGTIHRDHDMNSYVGSVQGVVRRELRRIRKAKRERRHKLWWSLVTPRGVDTSVIAGRPMALNNMGQGQINFSGLLQTGRTSLKRFTRLVASQHMHLLLVVFLFPARLLLLGTFNGITFR